MLQKIMIASENNNNLKYYDAASFNESSSFLYILKKIMKGLFNCTKKK